MKKSFAALLVSLLLAAPAWSAVNINTATQAELEAVSGIGPAKAKAILDHRQKAGKFKSLEDLEKVKGFGKASVAKLKGSLTAGPEKATVAK